MVAGEGEGGARDVSQVSGFRNWVGGHAFTPKWKHWESTGLACSRKLVEVYLMFLKDHIVISVSK